MKTLVPFDSFTDYGSLEQAVKAFHDGDVFVEKDDGKLTCKISLIRRGEKKIILQFKDEEIEIDLKKLTQEEIHKQIGPSRVPMPSGGEMIILTRLAEFRKDHLDHNIPLGAIVKYKTNSHGEIGITGIVKLYVIAHTRDCDGEPLYKLSDYPMGTEGEDNSFCEMARWRKTFATITLQGIPESALTVIEKWPTVKFWKNAKEELDAWDKELSAKQKEEI